MTAIAATPAIQSPADAPPPRTGSGGDHGFAPVLAAVQSPRDEPLPPTRSAAHPRIASGTPMPSGRHLPVVDDETPDPRADGLAPTDQDDVADAEALPASIDGVIAVAPPAAGQPFVSAEEAAPAPSSTVGPPIATTGAIGAAPPLTPPTGTDASIPAARGDDGGATPCTPPSAAGPASASTAGLATASTGPTATPPDRVTSRDGVSPAEIRATAADPRTTVAPPPATIALVPTASVVLPALQAFGAALHRAAAAERRPRRDPDPTAIAAPASAVTASLAAEAPAIDTTQPNWPGAMVARIEQLRDAHNESDTRIRLYPDALGAVDVTVRQDRAGTHVRLDAAEPATAKLLAEAQPRLQELAESRGLRLVGSEIAGEGRGGANGWNGQGHRPPVPAAAQPSVDRATPEPAAIDEITHTRIA